MTRDGTTIFAVATGAVRAAICVIRISGPATRDVLQAFCRRVPEARRATLSRLREPSSGEILDEALVLFFEAEKSELGEDSAEFHLHGSPAVVRAVLDALSALPGLRAAEPGEFARRAFLNGRMDLTQIEALADLVDAETAWQRRQAQRQLSGVLRTTVGPWRDALIGAAADLETGIDFAEDVTLDDLQPRVIARLAPIRAALAEALEAAPAAERVRSGLEIVIAGPPNAGKSSLLNALVRREAAIVSAIAGTTRDTIEVRLDLDGCPVTIVDTAGLRESADQIERIGIERARRRAGEADLVLWLSEGEPAPPDLGAEVWRLGAKADLGTRPAPGDLAVSAVTGAGLPELLARLTEFANGAAGAGVAALLTRPRHRAAFTEALSAIDALSEPGLPVELMAEELRRALFALDRLIGKVDVEDILGDIFSRFCIGK